MRRLLALVQGLPPGGALDRAANPDTLGVGWGNQEELLAVIAELVDQGNRDFAVANARPGAGKRQPITIDRPGRRPRKRQPEPGETLAALQQLHAHHMGGAS